MDHPAPAPANPPARTGSSSLATILGGAAVGMLAVGLGWFVLHAGGDVIGGGDDRVTVETTLTGGPAEASEGNDAAPEPFRDPFAGWDDPAAVLVLSGEVHGYLEPCGCTEKQSGGVARRSDLFRQLREDRGWTVLAADAGGSVRRTRKQTEFKLAAMRKALDLMGYGVANLGPEELRLNTDFLLQVAGDAPPLLGGNTVFYDDPELGYPERTVVLTAETPAGPLRVGFTGIIGRTMAGELAADRQAAGGFALTKVTDAADVLPGVLEELADCDVRVLLSQCAPDETADLLKAHPGFHAAVTAGGPEDPDPRPEWVETDAGKTLLLRVGGKGKYAGVLGLYPGGTQEPGAVPGPAVRFALVDLNRESYRHDRRMDAVMTAYQRALADNVHAVFDDIPPTAPPRPGGYVGAAKCGECHTKAYKKWKSTPHAHAYVSLTEGRKEFEGDWADRTHDPECLSCHVTGWDPQGYYPHVGGFLPEALAAAAGGGGSDGTEGLAGTDRFALLQGQQCENCHGPGSYHTAVFEAVRRDPNGVPPEEIRRANAAVHLEQATAAEAVCIKCHDGNNSPEFDFAKYWPEVAHPWRD